MRKVYENEKSSVGFAVAVLFSIGVTVVLFCAMPFIHRIAKPDRGLELRKVSEMNMEEKTEEKEPEPTVEEEKPPENTPPPQLTDISQQIPLSANLEVAVGSGGALEGFGNIGALAAPQSVQEDTFNVADLEKRPEAVSQIMPAYPKELAKAKVEGVVTILCVLSEEGRVEDPRVENSSRPEFEKPALEAVRKWRFRPGEKDGQAVRTYIRIPIQFRATTG